MGNIWSRWGAEVAVVDGLARVAIVLLAWYFCGNETIGGYFFDVLHVVV